MTDYSSSAASVKTALDAVYQAKLVSGTNIKTINNESLLGSGNISISGGGGGGGTTVLLNDDCSSNTGLTNYNSSSIRLTDGQSSTCSLTFDSTNNCYKLTGSGNNISGLNIIPLNSKDDVTVRVKFKLSNGNNYCQLILAVVGSLTNNTAFYGVRQMNGSFQNFRGNSSGGNETTISSISNITTQWHYLELKRSDTHIYCAIYDSAMEELASFSQTIPSWSDCYYLIGRNTENTNYYTLISEVYSEQSGGGGGSSVDIVTSWESTPSDSKVPSEKLVKDSLDDLETLVGNAITYINQ